jgi:hypothetical protein
MSILLRYLMVIVASIALLLGIQLPNLADQYAKRVDAHLREVTVNLQPFLLIANQYANGSIEELVELHRKSGVPPFRAEGDAIERMYQRKQHFEAERKALQGSLPGRLLHILWSGDPELREQTLLQYSAVVPLNQEALISGAVIALSVLVLMELAMALGRRLDKTATRWINHRWRGA